jgi:hypothetical protein
MLFDLSKRIARNRVVAGLHYELDNDAGVDAAEKCFELLKGGPQFRYLLDAAGKEGQPEREGTSEPEEW